MSGGEASTRQPSAGRLRDGRRRRRHGAGRAAGARRRSVTGLHGRQAAGARAIPGVVASSGEIPPALSQADAVIIAVRDERIAEVAERLVREQRLRREQVLLHTSGAHASAEVLAAARPHVRGVGTWHPLVSFADPRVAVEALGSVAFGIEGDEPARAMASRLVRALGARAVFLDGGDAAALSRGRGHRRQLRRGAGRRWRGRCWSRPACPATRRCRR